MIQASQLLDPSIALSSLTLRGGARGRLSILLYHRVLRAPDPLLDGDPDIASFRWQMALLSRYYRVLPLPRAVELLYRGELPARAVCVTFDDGYRDNAEHALPVLQEFGVPATFFIATGYLDGGRMFNDTIIETIRRIPTGAVDLARFGLGTHAIDATPSRRELIRHIIGSLKYRVPEERTELAGQIAQHLGIGPPNDLMMTRAQVRELTAAGMTVGGHTVSHPILQRLSESAAAREMAEGRDELAAITGQPVTLFAYPNGKPGTDYGPVHAKLARDLGFSAAVSTAWGVSSRQTDPYQLARFTPWDHTPLRFALRLARNGLHQLRH